MEEIIDKNNQKLTSLLLLLILFGSLLIRLPFLNVPLERDEGAYAYIAWRIEQGDIPYRDVFDHKPPGIYYLYFLIFKLLGKGIADIRLFTFLYTLLEVILIYKLGKKLFNKKVGLISATIFSYLTIQPQMWGYAANTEIFMLLPLIASVWFFILGLENPAQNKKLFFICGLLNGIALLFKQVAIFNFVFIFVFLLSLYIENKQKKIYELIKAYFYLTSGFLIILIVVFFYFWINRAWPDFVYWVFKYNLGYVGAIPITNAIIYFWGKFIYILRGSWLFWILGLYALYYFITTKKAKDLLLVEWFLFSFLGVSIGRRFLLHYFLQVMPPLAIACGFGLYKLYEQRIRQIENSFLKKIVFGIMLGIIMFVPFFVNFKYFFKYTPEQLAIELYGTSPLKEAQIIGQYLNKQSMANDSIAILGAEAELLFYAQRKSATRYICLYYIFMGPKNDRLKRQIEFFREIMGAKPKYIVVVDIFDSGGWRFLDKGFYIIDKMNQYINQNYFLDGFVIMGEEYSAYIFGQDQIARFCKEAYLTDLPPILIYRHR